ncbi:hypothetical protein JXL19_11360 [bacterium]|nr:hypothetical protein [bacterium]
MKSLSKNLYSVFIVVLIVFLTCGLSTAQNYSLNWQASLLSAAGLWPYNFIGNDLLITNYQMYPSYGISKQYQGYFTTDTFKNIQSVIFGSQAYHPYINITGKYFGLPSQYGYHGTDQPFYSTGYDLLNTLNNAAICSCVASREAYTPVMSSTQGQFGSSSQYNLINPANMGAWPAVCNWTNPFLLPWQKPYLLNASSDIPNPSEDTSKRMGLVLLSESSDSVAGLNNFVYELQSRGIPALLGVTASFAVANCENIKKLQKYGVEIRASYSSEAFWDKPYDEQYQLMRDTIQTIEACIGKRVRVFGSRYFAYDENTVKAAEALGIEYVLARGTSGAKATIYKPHEYNVKIFSVSNVDSEKWGTGSLCDYSYWSREGSIEQFREELFGSLNYDKISPVSHTYIGGLKASWMEVYLDFFDNADVNWVNLDVFGAIDVTLPFSEIPQNREVQYTTPIPLIPLNEEPDVENLHNLDDFPPVADVGDKIVMFHNNAGSMCLEALNFLSTIQYTVEEHLTTEAGFWDTLDAMKALFGSSQGVSNSFGYFPIIFIKDKAFSGFNDFVKNEILNTI